MAPAVASPPRHSAYQAALADLSPSPLNPRTHFDDLDDLAANIRVHGVLVPLLVRSRPDQTGLEIVDGERRYRAAQLAGNVHELPVVERDLEDDQVLEIQLLSAIQRQALTPLEEARGYRRLIDSNRAKYSAAYIADRIGRSEKYVVDRMRLAQLIPALQQLLDAERIGVAHAELLAKLKPEDQERAIDPGNPEKFGREREPGGLWQSMGRTLYDEAEDASERATADPYAGLKARTVKELEAWIARHVRFDVEHFAQTAPLDFGETAIKVEAAQQEPGRGRKVIQITEDYRIDDDVKDPSSRVYGRQSWKRADGTEGTSRGGRYGETRVDSPTCEHSVLGVVVVGPGYGTAYPVCIARDKCKVHWKAEIREREKRAKERATETPAKKTAKKEASWEERQKREEAERKRDVAAYRAVHPQILEALQAAVPRSFTDLRMVAYLWDALDLGDPPTEALPEDLPLALVTAHMPDDDPLEYSVNFELKTCLRILQAFGADPAPFERAFKGEVEALAKAAETKAQPVAAAKTAKKAAAKKATQPRRRRRRAARGDRGHGSGR
ncbi:MAG: ParB/RepB/Spo0J family partition protein [Candidatus Eisenbacteria bacterium]|nr:ParB/RepB/Spo0J family partition protein [Candidatus Eisenbacteria bacterium]